MKKYIISGLLVSVALLLYPVESSKVSAAVSFTDIDDTYAKDAILDLANKGIINGAPSGDFNPTGAITRQDFAIILAKALSLDVTTTPTTPTFSDIPYSHYSFNYVEAAVKEGLILGQGDGRFGVGTNLSRQDMATLFVRALGVDSTGYGSKLSFKDRDAISSYAKDAVALAVEIGLIQGKGDNTFDPRNLASRQDVALVTSKFLTIKEELEEPTPEPETPPVIDPIPNQEPETPPVIDPVPNPEPEIPPVTYPVPNPKPETPPISPIPDPNEPSIPINLQPNVEEELNDIIGRVGSSIQISIKDTFKDPDGDKLTIHFTTSNPDIVSISIDGDYIYLDMSDTGVTDVTLTADDGKGGAASQSFTVTVVPNHAPIVTQELTDQTLILGDAPLSLDLTNVFTDEDNDQLTFNVTLGNPEIAGASITGETLVISPIFTGTTSVTITADDGKGGTMSQSFNLTIKRLIRFEQSEGVSLIKNQTSPQNLRISVEILENTQVNKIRMEFSNITLNGDPNSKSYEIWSMFGQHNGANMIHGQYPNYVDMSYNNLTLSKGIYTVSIENGIKATSDNSTGTIKLFINDSLVVTEEFMMVE